MTPGLCAAASSSGTLETGSNFEFHCMASTTTTLDYARGDAGPIFDKWLHRFAVLLAVCTLGLIVAGAMVTSTGSGLAVPDWPTTYGENMFTFPPSKWVGGIFYEHVHRLIASTIGFLTIILAVWLHRREPRRWLRRLGWFALALVIVQGILGGLTVRFFLPTPISVLHGCTAQTFFCITIAIAVFTSRSWIMAPPRVETAARPALTTCSIILTGVVFTQLVLGAVMRHTESGLAILDFPLANGRIMPDISDSAMTQYNETRRMGHYLPEVTAAQVLYHMAHRYWAVVVAVVLLATMRLAIVRHGDIRSIWRLAWAGIALLCVQIGLGAWTVWSGRHPYIATAHVAVGAATLGTAWLLTLQTHRRLRTSSVPEASVLEGAVA